MVARGKEEGLSTKPVPCTREEGQGHKEEKVAIKRHVGRHHFPLEVHRVPHWEIGD